MSAALQGRFLIIDYQVNPKNIYYMRPFLRVLQVSQMLKVCLQYKRSGFYLWVRKILRMREWLPVPAFLGLP